MRLDSGQLAVIFQEFLKQILPFCKDPLDSFKTPFSGWVLTRRLKLCLRNKEVNYVVKGKVIDCQELIRIVRPMLKEPVYIVGLGYWFNESDLDKLVEIQNKFFG